jgi:hypothetical protein
MTSGKYAADPIAERDPQNTGSDFEDDWIRQQSKVSKKLMAMS